MEDRWWPATFVSSASAVFGVANLFAGPSGKLFFSGSGSGIGTELWQTDGLTTSLVSDIVPVAASSNPTPLLNSGGLLFFAATDPVFGTEVWITNGSITSRLKDINSAYSRSSPSAPVGVGAAVYWTASNGTSTELYKSGLAHR